MAQEKFTNDSTSWHDNGTRIEVPAGERVLVCTSNEIPVEKGRNEIFRDIDVYRSRGRYCVAIKIRDWYALIDSKLLSDVGRPTA